MNIALLVLRLVSGLLFMGHGLQKLVPANLSPPLLAASGPGASLPALNREGCGQVRRWHSLQAPGSLWEAS